MSFVGLLLLAVGLSMDAFAMSVCKGLAMNKVEVPQMCICGLWFGGFQVIMPLTGYFLGAVFAQTIEPFDHWIAFGLLALIGINMLKNACDHQQQEPNNNGDISFKSMFFLSLAASIDALAAGISLAMAGSTHIFLAIGLIGLVTFLFSAAGVLIGNIFGSRYEKKSEAVGGVLLIFLGIKILFQHLRVFI